MSSLEVAAESKPSETVPRFDLLVLSPHLDDAALSCGGVLHRCTREGGRALVVTVFAGDAPEPPSPFAREVEALWALGEKVTAERRAEDDRALERLGAETARWRFIDALYRTATDGAARYPDLRALRAEVRDPPELLAEIAEHVRELPSAHRILAPLAVGGHVDHQLTRRAVERVLDADPGLRFYEDFPYARGRFALRRALQRRRRWIDEVEALEDADLEARCEAILAYRSQLGAAFVDECDLRTQLRRFVARRGGERLWRRRRPPR
ncbi:MAG TPA: PIG-L family deacetylase [Thermoanaerobaculia bacterium]|nr:PIG-L family deacetylase [Thermoanaerobaculia bacterium]